MALPGQNLAGRLSDDDVSSTAALGSSSGNVGFASSTRPQMAHRAGCKPRLLTPSTLTHLNVPRDWNRMPFEACDAFRSLAGLARGWDMSGAVYAYFARAPPTYPCAPFLFDDDGGQRMPGAPALDRPVHGRR